MSTVLETPRIAGVRQLSPAHSLWRIATCALLFSVGAIYEATHLSSLSSISNSNFWWHLRTGLWILQNHAVPHAGIYSQSAHLPWIATSWLYDSLLAVAYKVFDLRVAPLLLAALRVLLAVLAFLLAGGLRGKFWMAVLLSGLAQYLLADAGPGPGYATVLFFAIELLLIFEVRRSGRPKRLFWLPALFLLWANTDIQFVYGILLLGLFLAALLIEQSSKQFAGTSPVRQSLAITTGLVGISLLATIITPYFYRSYGVFFASATSAANRYLFDYHAMSFRRPQDYLLLLLTMAAFLALGLRRSHDIFQITLLVGCAMLSFHLQRDGWLAVMVSIAILGDTTWAAGATAEAEFQKSWTLPRSITAALVIAVVLFAATVLIPRDRQALLERMQVNYPVRAADYVRDHHLPQPLFNPSQWGGFLMWYLPDYPVAIDGRAELYNDDQNIQYARFLQSQIPYSAYPPISRARTILLEKDSIKAQVLSRMPGYQVVYSDHVATVLLRKEMEQ